MAEPKTLILGRGNPLTAHEQETKAAVLQATVEHYLPEFVKGIKALMKQPPSRKSGVMYIHQDGFAAEYHDDECLLLGMAIKYAGMVGVEVKVVGKNGDTI